MIIYQASAAGPFAARRTVGRGGPPRGLAQPAAESRAAAAATRT